MGTMDAKFNGQIFRKDNPIILAMKRELAAFIGARIVYDANGYLPGQALVRKQSDGLFYKWAAASGGAYDSPCILFDTCTQYDQFADGDGLAGASGASLVRGIIEGIVYTNNIVGADSTFLTALHATAVVDAGGVALTKF